MLNVGLIQDETKNTMLMNLNLEASKDVTMIEISWVEKLNRHEGVMDDPALHSKDQNDLGILM